MRAVALAFLLVLGVPLSVPASGPPRLTLEVQSALDSVLRFSKPGTSQPQVMVTPLVFISPELLRRTEITVRVVGDRVVIEEVLPAKPPKK